MRTKQLNSSVTLNFGGGTEEVIEYECPCGKGIIIEQHNNVPGEYDHDVSIICEACRKKYEFDFTNGIRHWELVKK